MNMQAMLMQAQKMQRELNKAKEELANKEFTVTKGGVVKVVVLGDKTIQEIVIEEDAMNKEDKEMVEESMGLAINEAMEQIDKANEEINEKITGRKEGIGM